AAADVVAAVAADRTVRLKVGEPVQERFDVGASQRLGYQAVVVAGPQAFREPGNSIDALPDSARPAAAVAGQLVSRPRLGGLGQPWLADTSERQPAAVAEHAQVPILPGLLTAGVGQRPPDVADERDRQRPGRFARHTLDPAGGDRWCLRAAQRVTERPKENVGDLRTVANPLLDAEEHLDHHQRGEAPQAHLPALGDRGAGELPKPLVSPGLGDQRSAPPLVVSRAIAVTGLGSAATGLHQTRLHSRQRRHRWVGEELLQGGSRLAPPHATMRVTQRRPRSSWYSLAP